MTLKPKLGKHGDSRLECQTQKTGAKARWMVTHSRDKGLFARATLAAFRLRLTQLQLGLQIA